MNPEKSLYLGAASVRLVFSIAIIGGTDDRPFRGLKDVLTLLPTSRRLDLASIWSHPFKRWRKGGWKRLPASQLYLEYKLVRLLALIPSLSPWFR